MDTFTKSSLAGIVFSALLVNQIHAYMPQIGFEAPDYTSGSIVGEVQGAGWDLLAGSASVSPAGTGFGGGQALKLEVNPNQEALVKRSVDWNLAEKVAFIDLRIKPAADPEGSYASFYANGTQIAFQVPMGGQAGEIWVYNGNGGTTNASQWAKTVGTFALASNGLTASGYTRITLRHDYQRNIWDLFIGGKLAAANLVFEGRGANLEEIELYGSKVGDTLIDELSALTTNMLFADTDKDGIPDDWEIANGSNPNLYDRETIKPGTGKSYLDHYMDSLWLGGLNGNSALPAQGSIPPLTIIGSHQPVTSLKGSMSVAGDGAMTYSIPIDIPKGTAGMEPKISLNYSSNSANGIAGVGWSIGGLQSITRGVATHAKDGFAGTINFNGEDRFFFNGERLVCIAGIYGMQNSEYRTEIDSFARITLKGGDQNNAASWWQVETKAGLIIELGNSADSKIIAPTVGAPLVWDASRVSDTVGNYYTLHWADTRTMDHLQLDNRRLSHIAYTGSTLHAPYCRIDFGYEARPDTSFAYSPHGTRMENSLRLGSIKASTDNQTNHTYLLNYDPSAQSSRSLLKSVFRQQADGSTINPTVFSWDGLKAGEPRWAKVGAGTLPRYSGASFDSNTVGVNSIVSTNGTSIRLDGDVARFHTVPGNINVTTGTFIEFDFRGANLDNGAYLIPDANADFNNTGVGEFCIRIKPPGAPATTLPSRRVVTRSGRSEIVTYVSPVFRDHTYTAANAAWQTFRVSFQGDPNAALNLASGTFANLVLMNADDKADNGTGYAEFRNIRIGTAAQLDSNSVAPITFPETFDVPRFSFGKYTLGTRLMDVNSDGLVDIVDHRVDVWGGENNFLPFASRSLVGAVYENTGKGFRINSSLSPPTDAPLTDSGQLWAYRHDLVSVPCDINSDGILDLLCTDLQMTSTYTSIQTYHFKSLVNGQWQRLSSFDLPFHSRNNSSSGKRGGQKHLVSKDIIDLDRDGYPDLCIRTSPVGWLANSSSANILPENTGTVFLNRNHLGQGWVRADHLNLPLALAGISGDGLNDLGNRLLDVNGDGFQDMISASDSAALTEMRAAHRFRPAALQAVQSPWATSSSGVSPADIPAWWLPAAPSLDGNAPLIDSSGKSTGTFLLDLNGDGLVDINRAFSRKFIYYQINYYGRERIAITNYERSHSTWFNTGRETSDASSRWLRDSSPYGSGYTLPISLTTQDLGEDQSCHRFADLNGDGLVDILYSRDGTKMAGPHADRPATTTDPFGGTNNGAFINTGSGWTQDTSWGLPPGIRHGKMNTPQEAAILADLNGDGFPDMIGKILDGQQPELWLNKARPEVITAVTDGFGSELQVEYRRLNDPSPTPAFGSRVFEPFQGTPPPGHARIIDSRLVVSRYSEADGRGGRKAKSQRYGDLRFDRKNEASLGFGWIEALDESNGQLTRTDYRRDFPFAGSPSITQTSVNLTAADIADMPPNCPGSPAFSPGRKNLSIETATYAEMSSQSGAGGVIRRPVQTGSVKQLFDLDGTLKSQNVTTQSLADFDPYGFVLQSTVRSLDRAYVHSQNQYQHITTGGKWHLGRLTQATVTKSDGLFHSITKTSAFTYHPATGLLKSETVQPGHPLSVTTAYTHDAFGNVASTAVTARTGDSLSSPLQTRSASTFYDSRGRFVETEVNHAGHTTTYQYDGTRALLQRTTDMNGFSTWFTYDSFSTLIITHHPDGTKTGEVTGYATNFSVPSSVAALIPGHTIRFFRAKQSSGAPEGRVYLDALGRELVTETTILRDAISTGASRYSKVYAVTNYDLQGRKTAVSESFRAGETPDFTTIQYDLLSRVTATLRPGGLNDISLAMGYCILNGQPVSYSKARNAAGQTLERWEDQHGRLIRSVDPSGQITTFSHDPENRLTSLAVGSDSLLTNIYDIMGNRTMVIEANSGSSASTYNGFGELVSATNANFETTTSTYDSLGRPVSVQKPEGTYTTTYSQASGPTLGLPLKISGPDGYLETFSYDSLGRPISTSKTQFGETFTTATTYDALGRVSSSTDAGGLTVFHEYDATYSFPVRQKLAPGTYEGAGTVLWQAGTYDSQGRSLTQTLAKESPPPPPTIPKKAT